MKISSLISLGSAAALLTFPVVAHSQSLVGFGGGGPQQLHSGASKVLPRRSNGAHKVRYNRATGKTYNIYYLPSGRTRIVVEGGGEYIYNPRNGEVVTIKAPT